MTRKLFGGTSPELVALCRWTRPGALRWVGSAMVVAERVVVYVPEHPSLAGGGLLNTYSSLASADRLLAHAGIHSVREWSTLLSERLAGPRLANP